MRAGEGPAQIGTTIPPWWEVWRIEPLRSYIAVLRKRRGLVIVLPVVLAVSTFLSIYFGPRTYVARGAFVASEPTSLSSSLGALGSVAAQLGVPGLSTLASGSASGSPQFYADLLVSNTLLDAIVTARYDAAKDEEYGGKPFSGTLVEYLKATGATAPDREADAMKRLLRNVLSVTVDRTTGIVRFEVRTKNRQLSSLVARRVLDLINDFNLRRRQTQAGAERDFDAERVKASLDSVHVAESDLSDFRAANIDFSHSPALATRETALQRRLSLAQSVYTTIAQRYEMARIEAVRNTPVVTVIDAPEGMTAARSRYVGGFSIGAFFVGLIVACVMALGAERYSVRR
jgi:uncharacterized protein involved in exopolysaccharide biosynthesis